MKDTKKAITGIIAVILAVIGYLTQTQDSVDRNGSGAGQESGGSQPVLPVSRTTGGQESSRQTPAATQPAIHPSDDDEILKAFQNRISDLQVRVRGEVIRLLPDDNEGSRHQKFIIRLDNGHTLLVSHNIDLAPRVDDIEVGQTVAAFGEYEWNRNGGVIHWTHHDPAGRHVDGYVQFGGRQYK